MKKVMFIGDLHWRDKNPPHRIDDYRQDIENCLVESFNIAKSQKCGAVILLGDLFDRYEPSGSVRNRVCEICYGMVDPEKPIDPWPFEIYTLIGNHDVDGTPETIRRTGLYSVSLAGVKIPDYSTDFKAGDWPIHMVHWIDDVEFMDYTDVESKVLAMHAFVLPDEDDFPGKHIKIKDFKVNLETKLVICGHYHPGYGPITREDGVIFYNPGSICRMSAIKNNIERKIKVAIVEFDNDWNIKELKEHYLKSAKPGNIIFDVLGAEKIRKENKDRKDFLKVVEQIRNEEKLQFSDNPIDDLKIWCESNGADEDILKIISNEYNEMIKDQTN